MIQCSELWFGYSDQPIIQGLTAKWGSDVINVVQGGMGSGKSTLAKLLVGALKARSGEVRFGVDDPSLWTSATQGLGYVPQIGERTHHRVYELLQQVMWAEGIHRKAEERASAILYQVGLSGFEQRSLVTLSGFELSRLYLALALVKNPQYLILDEVPLLQDKRWRDVFEGMLRGLLARGCTVLWLSVQRPDFELPMSLYRLHHGGCSLHVSSVA